MLEIMPATPDDAEAISRVAVQGFTDTFGHLYTTENLQYHLEKSCSPAYFSQAIAEGDCILLARVKGQMAGYIKAGKLELPVEHAGRAYELHRLYVLEAYQGQAVGKALMDAMLLYPPFKNAEALYLGVWENNHKAQMFYARYGFAPVGEYTYYVGSHADRELILKRERCA